MNARADISTARAADDCLVGMPLLDPAAARALILADVRGIEGEEVIPLGALLGRVAAADIRSPVALPRFDNSAVDGFGLHIEDLQRQPPFSLSIVAKVAAGHGTGKVLRPGQAFRILTGARIPEGVSAVILEERTSRSAAEVTLHTVPEVGANIRGRGEDVALDTVVVPCGTILDARHLAILAASGASSAPVFRRLRIGVMSTGDELVEPAIDTTPNNIIDTNRPMLLSLLSSNAFDVVDLGIVPDDCDNIERTISRASLHLDLLLSSGGVAGSDADHLDPAIRAAGGRCMPLKLALRPGKPIAKGKVGDMHVLALPGNPVAALVNFLLFGRPLIRRMMGAIEAELRPQFSRTDGLFDHRSGRTEFVPVRIEGRGADGLPIVGKLGRGGSARLLPLVMCDGFAEIGPDVGDLETGAMVRYHPFSTAFGL